MKNNILDTNLTRQLADFSADFELHKEFPKSAIQLAELAITDTVACILAGIEEPAAIKLGSTMPDEPGGPSRKSSSVRHRHSLSARDAAAVNACAAHARELDDNVLPAVIHSSVVLTPALFALAEEIDATAEEVVRAFIVGKEVNAHVGNLVVPMHFECGWNTNSTIGVFGAAAACATLLKLNSEQIVHALSLAFSMSSGPNIQFGTEAKPLHCGMAADWGIWAARLAQRGFTGHPDILQGKGSFQDLYAGPRDAPVSRPKLFPLAPLAIDAYPPVTKLYPCCGSSHLGIDAIRALQARSPVSLDDIGRIDIHMIKIMCDTLRYATPTNEMEARFSMPYCAAVSLVHGMPRLEHFSPEAISHPHPQVARLVPLVRTHVRIPTAEVIAKKLAFHGDCLVEIHLKNGDVFRQIAEHPKGCEANPLTEEERRTKFFDCVATSLGETRTSMLYEKLLDFSAIGRLDEITAAFKPGAARNEAI